MYIRTTVDNVKLFYNNQQLTVTSVSTCEWNTSGLWDVSSKLRNDSVSIFMFELEFLSLHSTYLLLNMQCKLHAVLLKNSDKW